MPDESKENKNKSGNGHDHSDSPAERCRKNAAYHSLLSEWFKKMAEYYEGFTSQGEGEGDEGTNPGGPPPPPPPIGGIGNGG